MSKSPEETRRSHISKIMEEIEAERRFERLCSLIEYKIYCLWMQYKAQEDNFFEGQEWTHPRFRDELLKKTRQFLIKNIR